jgi:excisionase family DNA binding protein
MDKNAKLLLRVTEAAELLSVSRSKCYQMVNRKEIPSLRLGGGVRIPPKRCADSSSRASRTRRSSRNDTVKPEPYRSAADRDAISDFGVR